MFPSWLNPYLKLVWVLFLIVILWITCQPNPPEISHQFNDKLSHLLAFFFLGILSYLIWNKSIVLYRILPFLALYGAFIEFAQYFIPGRSLSLFDWIMDILGLIAAMLVVKLKYYSS